MKNLHRGADKTGQDAGFTLIELISVMVIVGILGAVAAPKFFIKPSYDIANYFNQAQTLVRYGQTIAIAQDTAVYVRLNGASVALCYDSACTSTVAAPSGANSGSSTTLAACGNNAKWACEAPASGVSFATSGATTMFYYSPQGKPYNNTDFEPISSFTSLLTITLSASGVASQSFFVAPETGYVYH